MKLNLDDSLTVAIYNGIQPIKNIKKEIKEKNINKRMKINKKSKLKTFLPLIVFVRLAFVRDVGTT